MMEILIRASVEAGTRQTTLRVQHCRLTARQVLILLSSTLPKTLIKFLRIDGTKTSINLIRQNLMSFVSAREYLNIAGAPTSGKSTLARALYLDLQRENNLVPVLLDAKSLRG